MAKTNKPEDANDAAAQATGTALSVLDFSADAGHGMEGATQDAFAIPFLSVLQKGSPTVDEALPTYVEGHKAGQLFENVSGQTFDGKAGVLFVPCAFRRVFVRWAPRDLGGGFKGEVSPEEVAELRAQGKIVEMDGRLLAPLDDGTIHEKKCDRFSDTRNHYGLLVTADGGWRNVLISLASTQIKKSRMLMSMLAGVKLGGPSGMYTPPTFANLVKLTTIGESNDKGSWFGVKFELAGQVQRADIYAAAKAFHAAVVKGAVTAKYEEPADDAPSASGGF